MPKGRPLSIEDIRESKEIILQDIEKKLRLKDDSPTFAHQQVISTFFNVLTCSNIVLYK